MSRTRTATTPDRCVHSIDSTRGPSTARIASVRIYDEIQQHLLKLDRGRRSLSAGSHRALDLHLHLVLPQHRPAQRDHSLMTSFMSSRPGRKGECLTSPRIRVMTPLARLPSPTMS